MYCPPFFGSNITKIEKLTCLDLPDAIVIDLWENTDLFDNLRIYAPENKAKIISKENAERLTIIRKTLLKKYPLKSRPVLEK